MMYYRIIRNDVRRSKAITLTTMLFVAAAAMLFWSSTWPGRLTP